MFILQHKMQDRNGKQQIKKALKKKKNITEKKTSAHIDWFPFMK